MNPKKLNIVLGVIILLFVGLIVFSLAVIDVEGQPFAEIEPFVRGKDYDTTFLGYVDGLPTFLFESKQERIQTGVDADGKPIYQNYNFWEDTNEIFFESASMSLKFDKNNCVIKIFESGALAGKQPKTIISHTVKEAINGTDTWQTLNDNLNVCIVDVSNNNNILEINASKGNFKTIYEINYAFGFEFTYEYKSTKNGYKYGVTMVCDGEICDKPTIDKITLTNNTLTKSELGNKTIALGDLSFDSKNKIHDYLWMIKKEDDKLIVDFTHAKNQTALGDKMIIDPVFSSNNPDEDGTLLDNVDDETCDDGASRTNTPTALSVYLYTTGQLADCQFSYVQWPTSGIPDNAIIEDVKFDFDVNFVNNPINCSFMQITNKPTTASDQTLFDDILNTPTYVDDSSVCTTTGDNKQVDLGDTANTDLKNLLTENWFAVGIRTTSVTVAGATSKGYDLVSEEGVGTPDPTLTVTYHINPPNKPTNFSGLSEGKTVLFSWTASTTNETSKNGVTTYYLGRSLDNSTFTNKTSTGNVTNYLSSQYWRINQQYYANITATNSIQNSTSTFTSLLTDTIPTAVTNPSVTGLTTTSIIIRWAEPTSDGRDPLDDYKVRCEKNHSGGWVVHVTNSTLTVRNFNVTGLASGDVLICQIAVGNDVDFGPWSTNATGYTYHNPDGSAKLSASIIGNVAQFTGNVTIATGFPNPTIKSFKLYNSTNHLLSTENINISYPIGTTKKMTPQNMTITNGSFRITVLLENTQGSINKTSNNVTAIIDYTPVFHNSIEGSYFVNYTQNRNTTDTGIKLKVNRLPVSIWPIECSVQQDIGVVNWFNVSSIHALSITLNVERQKTAHVNCYNDELLFSFSSEGNTSGVWGLTELSKNLGGLFGIPLPFLFALIFASLFTGRTAHVGIFMIGAVLGIMSLLGLFELAPAAWGIIILIIILGIFSGKKLF